MGTVKVELDIPEFKKELKIEITIKKDGEVVCTTSPDNGRLTTRDNQSLATPQGMPISNKPVVTNDPIVYSKPVGNSGQSVSGGPKKGGSFGGNYMGADM